jgi:hypothetical protein
LYADAGKPLAAHIVNYGEESSTVTVGDRFVLYADGIDTDGTGEDGIFWQSDGSGSRFLAPFDDCLTYRIIDTRTHRPISSGSILVPGAV